MFKKITIYLSLVLLTSCQFNTSTSKINQVELLSNTTNIQSKDSSDWHSLLSSELQNYYADAKGKQGLDLLKALHNIVNQAEVLDYGDATSYLYTVVDYVQQGQIKGIREGYSNLIVQGDGPSGHKYKEIGDANGDGKKGDAINCEHTWPQSFFNKEGEMRTDMHHLFPTLSTPNSKRGSFPFGMASEGKVTYSTTSGSKLIGLADHSYVFEVSNIQKGNTARAFMYFYLRYYDKNIRSNDYISQSFFVSRLPVIDKWLLVDPVDQQEKNRNEAIFKRQKNRNPFIDIPNLSALIGIDQYLAIEKTFK